MKVTLAHPVSSMSGSVDHQTGAHPGETLKTSGLTFFVWKGLQLARMLVLPKNPRSLAQIAVRNIQTSLARAWSASLSAPQRLAWVSWASAHGFADGFQAFMSTAWAPYAYDGTLIDDAPATTAPAFAATLTSATFDISSGSLVAVFSGVSMDPAQDVITLVELTTKKLPGAQQVRDTDYRSAAATLAGSLILDVDPTDGGFLASIASGVRTADTPAAGDRRYARYTVFDLASGQKLISVEGLVTMAE